MNKKNFKFKKKFGKYAKNIQTWNSMISYNYTHTPKHILKLLCRQNTKKRVNIFKI